MAPKEPRGSAGVSKSWVPRLAPPSPPHHPGSKAETFWGVPPGVHEHTLSLQRSDPPLPHLPERIRRFQTPSQATKCLLPQTSRRAVKRQRPGAHQVHACRRPGNLSKVRRQIPAARCTCTRSQEDCRGSRGAPERRFEASKGVRPEGRGGRRGPDLRPREDVPGNLSNALRKFPV